MGLAPAQAGRSACAPALLFYGAGCPCGHLRATGRGWEKQAEDEPLSLCTPLPSSLPYTPSLFTFETGPSQMLTGLVLGAGPSRTPAAPPEELIAKQSYRQAVCLGLPMGERVKQSLTETQGVHPVPCGSNKVMDPCLVSCFFLGTWGKGEEEKAQENLTACFSLFGPSVRPPTDWGS